MPEFDYQLLAGWMGRDAMRIAHQRGTPDDWLRIAERIVYSNFLNAHGKSRADDALSQLVNGDHHPLTIRFEDLEGLIEDNRRLPGFSYAQALEFAMKQMHAMVEPWEWYHILHHAQDRYGGRFGLEIRWYQG